MRSPVRRIIVLTMIKKQWKNCLTTFKLHCTQRKSVVADMKSGTWITLLRIQGEFVQFLLIIIDYEYLPCFWSRKNFNIQFRPWIYEAVRDAQRPPNQESAIAEMIHWIYEKRRIAFGKFFHVFEPFWFVWVYELIIFFLPNRWTSHNHK